MAIPPVLFYLLLLTLAGGAAGIWLAEIPRLARRVVPFSGGVVVGVALFWMLPEIAADSGWLWAAAGVTAGFALLWSVDKFLYPVCPACAHSHDHHQCNAQLHGFAVPLIVASGVHSMMDGWALTIAQGQVGLKAAFTVGIAMHKLPEGLALGVLLLAALGSAWRAAVAITAVQSMMLVGAAAALYAGPHLNRQWMSGILAAAAGAFVYLGYHAIESEYRERGLATAALPAITGAAGAAALRGFLPGI
ncbi:MAG: ZIP family metal transporter [Acidobacteriota bacterium]|nr:ZIP family metal transporter [Acidobacteriota bacterium]